MEKELGSIDKLSIFKVGGKPVPWRWVSNFQEDPVTWKDIWEFPGSDFWFGRTHWDSLGMISRLEGHLGFFLEWFLAWKEPWDFLGMISGFEWHLGISLEWLLVWKDILEFPWNDFWLWRTHWNFLGKISSLEGHIGISLEWFLGWKDTWEFPWNDFLLFWPPAKLCCNWRGIYFWGISNGIIPV